MPEKKTIARARRDRKEGKSASTQAGEFVREEIEHVRRGKHGARSPQQAIAIGLSKARRAGVRLPPPKPDRASGRTRKRAERDVEAGSTGHRRAPAARRSRATKSALKREGRSAASTGALSRHARGAARRRTASERSAAARKAARTRQRRTRRTTTTQRKSDRRSSRRRTQ